MEAWEKCLKTIFDDAIHSVGTKRKDVPFTTNSKKQKRRKGMQMKEKRNEDVALKKRGKGNIASFKLKKIKKKTRIGRKRKVAVNQDEDNSIEEV
jgi:hypothetical protein